MFVNQYMNTKCEQALIQMFTGVIKGENDLEAFRVNLLHHINLKGINYSNCFTHLSAEKIISVEMIADFLSFHSIKYDQSELQALNYQNFLDLLLPSKHLKEVKQRDLLFGVPIPETLKMIAIILEKELSINRAILAHLETLAQRYERRQLLGLLPSLIPLCQKLRLNLKSDDYICLLRRFDKDHDNDVKYADWEYFLDRVKQRKYTPKQINNYEYPTKLIDKENTSSIANSQLKKSNVIAQRQKSTPDHPYGHKNKHLDQQMKSFVKSRIQKQEVSQQRDYEKIHAYIEKLDSQSQENQSKYINEDYAQQSNPIEISQYQYSDCSYNQALSQTQSYYQLQQPNEFQEYINSLQDIMDEILKQSKSLCDITNSLTIFNYLDIDMDGVLNIGDLKVFFVTQNMDIRESEILQFVQTFALQSVISFEIFQDLFHNHQNGSTMKLSLNGKSLMRDIFSLYFKVQSSLKANKKLILQHESEISQFMDPALLKMIINLLNSQ